jgi:hypothetical protein
VERGLGLVVWLGLVVESEPQRSPRWDRGGQNAEDRPIHAERIRRSWEARVGEVASGERPLGARGKLMTSWKKQQQVPRCARNDNSQVFRRAARRVAGVEAVPTRVQVGVMRAVEVRERVSPHL